MIFLFFFNDTATTEIYTLSLHDALPISRFESEPDLDLVLTDLVMPGRTGWDVAAGVKARRPHVAVGLITGWGDTTDVDEARRALVDFVVEKPVTVEALQEAVARVRDR